MVVVLYLTIVNSALLELNTDVSEDMSALIIVANMRPRAPTGKSSIANFGNTWKLPLKISV